MPLKLQHMDILLENNILDLFSLAAVKENSEQLLIPLGISNVSFDTLSGINYDVKSIDYRHNTMEDGWLRKRCKNG